MRAKDALGRTGERTAREYLLARGHELVDANWRCREGEIDLVTFDHGMLVVTEVKTRSSTRTGDPLEAVTSIKLRRLRRLAGLWLEAHPRLARPVRIDVIGVLVQHGREPVVRHVAGVGP